MNNILLLYTSHRQLEEVNLQSLLNKRYGSHLLDVDMLFYCNSPMVDKVKLEKYLGELPHKNKKLIYTDKNIGYLWGGHESLSQTFNVWKEYNYCIHLHPDVFILNDQHILKMISEMKDEDFINTHNLDPLKDDNKDYLSFDFFIFKPRQILNKIGLKNYQNSLSINPSYEDENFFNLYLDDNEKKIAKTPEHLLSRIIKKYNLKSKIIQRYDNNYWEPRRPDMIGLYHEHDLTKIQSLINGIDIFPVFINIERFEDRRKNCINAFSHLFPKEFYMLSGVDGKYVNIYDNKCKHQEENKEEREPIATIEYNEEYFIHNPNFRMIRMSYGEIGCYLSHLKLYQYMVDNNIELMFICEDDILMSEHIYKFNDYIVNLPKKETFDICLFHHNPEFIKRHIDKSIWDDQKEREIEKKMVDEKINDYYYKLSIRSRTKSQKFIQALSYLITYKGAVNFLTRVKSNIHVPIDDQLGNAGLNVIYSKDVLFHQNIKMLESSIWNIYKENENYENVKWDKEINKEIKKNVLTRYSTSQ